MIEGIKKEWDNQAQEKVESFDAKYCDWQQGADILPGVGIAALSRQHLEIAFTGVLHNRDGVRDKP